MHLLREGQFALAVTFHKELEAKELEANALLEPTNPNRYVDPRWDNHMVSRTFDAAQLQQQFAEMYHILYELRQRNLAPAIAWAREHSAALEARGSKLEFQLCRLQSTRDATTLQQAGGRRSGW